MGAELKFTLICDDARVEVSNKVIVIGLYNYSINFSQAQAPPTQPGLPVHYALPQLCLVRRWFVDSPGVKVKTELIDPEGKAMQVAERELRYPSEDNFDQEIINIRGILLTKGRYKIRTSISGAVERTLEDAFEVRIAHGV